MTKFDRYWAIMQGSSMEHSKYLSKKAWIYALKWAYTIMNIPEIKDEIMMNKIKETKVSKISGIQFLKRR